MSGGRETQRAGRVMQSRLAHRVARGFGGGHPGVVRNRVSGSCVQHNPYASAPIPHSQLPPAKRNNSTIRRIPLPSSFTSIRSLIPCTVCSWAVVNSTGTKP